MQLAAVLSAHRVRPPAPTPLTLASPHDPVPRADMRATHTSMGGAPFAGSFCIPAEADARGAADAFTSAYVDAVERGLPVAMVERHTTTGPVIIDLDFRLTTPQRAYTRAGIDAFLDALVSTTRNFVSQSQIEVVVLEKPSPRPAAAGTLGFKDGIHVVLPNVVTHPEVQLAIRDSFVADGTQDQRFAGTVRRMARGDAFDETDACEVDIDLVFDKSVITSGGGWLMYGSKKPDEPHPWRVTRWHRVDMRDNTISDVDFAAMSTRQIVDALSIRVPPSSVEGLGSGAADAPHSPYTRAAEDVMAIAREGSVTRTSSTTTNEDNDAFVTSIGARQLADLVDLLDGARATSYESWMRAGWAISNTRVGTRAERLAVWKAFARRDAHKYVESEHDSAWGRMEVRDGARALGIGTLRFWAKTDSPAAYAEWVARVVAAKVTRAVAEAGAGIDKARVLQDLRGKLGDVSLDDDVLDVVDEAIQFMSTDGKLGSVHKHRYMVQLEQQFYGSLVDKFEMTDDLSFLKNVPSGGTYTCALHAADGRTISNAVLDGKNANEDVKIRLLNMQSTDGAHVRVTGAAGNATIKGVRDVRRLMQMVFQGQDRHFAEYNITFNIGTVNINNSDGDTAQRSEVDFADRLKASNPELFRRLRHLPDINKDSCVGNLYYCDPENNRWGRHSNAVMENKLAAAFGCIDGVTRDDMKFIRSNRGGKGVLQVVAREVVDEGLLEYLDTNLDLFAVNNGVFDTTSGQVVFRPLEIQDYVKNHTTWDYSPLQAREKRAEVEEFLAQVLPIAEEREVVLGFFASLLSGRRREKKFLIVTDKSGGDNGKSTFMRLITDFFGKQYCSSTGTKFACQASIAKGRDSHDAGFEYVRGIRLLVGDELKSSLQLDEGTLKRVVGGEGTAIAGRSFKSSDMFDFVWQAGIVLIFNEGDCPKFDGGDAAFIKRMIIAPFRSSFVYRLTPGAENEFVVLDDITVRFSSWMSALADVLVARFLPNRQAMFATLPASMLDWKNDITGAANPIADWLEKRVEVTGDPSDTVWLGDLKSLWKESHFGSDAKVLNAKLVKAFFATNATVEFKDVARVQSVGGDGVVKKNVLKGCTLRSCDLVIS